MKKQDIKKGQEISLEGKIVEVIDDGFYIRLKGDREEDDIWADYKTNTSAIKHMKIKEKEEK